jgi:hypothetical protein
MLFQYRAYGVYTAVPLYPRPLKLMQWPQIAWQQRIGTLLRGIQLTHVQRY